MRFLTLFFYIVLITGCAKGSIGGSNEKFHVRGQIIDQYGHPVSDVEVTYHYAYNDSVLLVLPSFNPIVKSGHFITVKDGRFDLGIFSVQSFMITDVTKPGYYYARQDANYTNRDEEKQTPLTIHLWKIGKTAAYLIKKRLNMFGIQADGTNFILDLRHGVYGNNITSSTDIKISLKHTRLVPKTFNGDWTMQISIPGGGLIESSDLYMYEAPSEGYQPFWRTEKNRVRPYI